MVCLVVIHNHQVAHGPEDDVVHRVEGVILVEASLAVLIQWKIGDDLKK